MEAVICITWLCVLADKKEVLLDSQFTCWSESESAVLHVNKCHVGISLVGDSVIRDREEEMPQVLQRKFTY